MRKLVLSIVTCFFLCFISLANAAQSKTWTFLIFLNGNNNLDSYGEENIKAMEKVGSNDEVNIVVQWASQSAGKAVRLLVQKSTDPDHVTSPVVQDLGLVDMGSYVSLEDFIKWGVENYPADHYFIDIWDHGSGWHLKFKPRVVGDISYDDNSGNAISTEQLGQVMQYAASIMGHKVDLYGSDACLMGMAEVATEMGDSVQYYVGSQETEPGAGWPYAEFLSAWTAIPNATPTEVAKALVSTYVKSYQNGSNGYDEVTMSAYRLDKLNKLNHAIAKLSTDIQEMNAKNRYTVLALATGSQHFAYVDYADLLDFVARLKKSVVKIDAKDLKAIESAAQDFIIANEVTKHYINAHGLSIWLPVTKAAYKAYSHRYKNLVFNAKTAWHDALAEIVHS